MRCEIFSGNYSTSANHALLCGSHAGHCRLLVYGMGESKCMGHAVLQDAGMMRTPMVHPLGAMLTDCSMGQLVYVTAVYVLHQCQQLYMRTWGRGTGVDHVRIGGAGAHQLWSAVVKFVLDRCTRLLHSMSHWVKATGHRIL